MKRLKQTATNPTYEVNKEDIRNFITGFAVGLSLGTQLQKGLVDCVMKMPSHSELFSAFIYQMSNAPVENKQQQKGFIKLLFEIFNVVKNCDSMKLIIKDLIKNQIIGQLIDGTLTFLTAGTYKVIKVSYYLIKIAADLFELKKILSKQVIDYLELGSITGRILKSAKKVAFRKNNKYNEKKYCKSKTKRNLIKQKFK